MARAKMNEESRKMYLARALYDAVEDCNIRQVSVLLSQNRADPNILILEEGMTAFHLAAGHENVAFGKVVVSLFLHNGADPNIRCDGNRTVLHIAVAWNRSSVVEVLLKSSYIVPNPYLKDDDNLNVFNYAVKFSAWESLAILQSFIKDVNLSRNSNSQLSQTTDSKLSENEEQKINQSTDNESVLNKSQQFHTSSGYLNSSNSLNNISKSINDNSTSQKYIVTSPVSATPNSPNDVLNKNITVSYSDVLNENITNSYSDIENQNTVNSSCDVSNKNIKNSCSDVLNKNISSEHNCSGLPDNISSEHSCTGLPENMSSHIYFDGSLMSSIKSVHDEVEFEDIENITFPSQNLLTDSEIYKLNEVELTSDNTSSLLKQSFTTIDSELMSDISGLSSYLESDDYYTCPDTNSQQKVLNKKHEKTDRIIDNLTFSSLTSLFDSLSQSIPNISKEKNNSEVSDISSDSSDIDVSTSLTENTGDYDTDFVRQSLRKFGHPPGPLVATTKQLYVRKLNRILKDQTRLQSNDKSSNVLPDDTYSSQLVKVLTDDKLTMWSKTLKCWSSYEKDIICPLSGSSFTYLLLDPRITRNLPARADQFQNPIEIWQTFISSIFYVGKGTKSRPNDHMNEAFNSWIGQNCRVMSRKTECILDLWRENMGVVCVQAFHHLVPQEAHIREAAMIDAIGLNKLANEKRGTYYNNTIRWRNSDRCKLGCYLLHRAMHVFLADGERQLKPIDLT